MSGSGQSAVATPLRPREGRHWWMASVSITSELPVNRFLSIPCAVQSVRPYALGSRNPVRAIRDPCHRVQDEIELARLSIHLFRVSRNNNLLLAQFQGVLTFAFGGCKRHNVSAKGSRELDPHMTQTTDADNTDFAPRS